MNEENRPDGYSPLPDDASKLFELASADVISAEDVAAEGISTEVVSFESYIEDELEIHLDSESDDDFGLPVIRDRDRVKLAEWSAQDFSNIYVRFRPHLERHARRFLRGNHLVDEVVQDAFLYLMVTLPELDSEIGVLRFLKWKVRLLCIDVIRANSRAYINNIDDAPELASNDPEISSNLEAAEDAAVVRLALSKLNPRHREVLISSMYLEKSTEEIAAQVGLSENATRQLIFRARGAFKKALLGDDVDTTGMSAAEILSVAARKAAQDAKKVGVQAMVLLILVVSAVSVWPRVGGTDDTDSIIADGDANVLPAPRTTDSLNSPSGSSTEPSGTDSASPSTPGSTDSSSPSSSTPAVPSALPSSTPSVSAAPSVPATEPAPDAAPASAATVFNALDGFSGYTNTSSDVTLLSTRTNDVGDVVSQTFSAAISADLTAIFDYLPGATNPIQNVSLQVIVNGVDYISYPISPSVTVTGAGDVLDIVYSAQIKHLIDENDFVLSAPNKSPRNMTIRFSTDADGLKRTGVQLVIDPK